MDMTLGSAVLRRTFVVVMLAGSALITAASLVYFDFGTLPPFAVEKLPVRFEALWLLSLRVHVVSALSCFPLCLVLSTRRLQRRTSWHRMLGRVASGGTLFGVVPSGFVLALDAKGGPLVTAGFLLSGAIVAGAIVRGVMAARRRDLLLHARAMRHVVAQMSVAVTSRAMLFALDLMGSNPDLAYVIALWVPVVVSALVAEAVSLRRKISWSKAVFPRVAKELS
jgi:uncharacterized membrane protein YozB (DUF420 family)